MRNSNFYIDHAITYTEEIKDKVDGDDLAYFMKLVPLPSRVLDVGCAGGRDVRMLSDLGYKVVGFDMTHELLKIAHSIKPDSVIFQADMTQIPFTHSSFDGIRCTAALDHLKDHESMKRAIGEFYRVLKINGIAYLSTRAGNGILETDDYLTHGQNRSFLLTSEDNFNNILDYHGFKILNQFTKRSSSRSNMNFIHCFAKKT